MIVAVIVGSRSRSNTKGIESKEDKDKIQADDKWLVNQVLSNLVRRYKNELRVISFACDDGVGKIVRDSCVERDIKMAEMQFYFHGKTKWDNNEAVRCYLSRTPALMQLGDVFVLLADSEKLGVLDEIIKSLRSIKESDNDRPYIVLNEEGRAIEEHKQGSILG